MPKLNRSHFSKVESKSYLGNSNLESSFGGENAIKSKSRINEENKA